MAKIKHYVLTSVTLGLIAASSALLIAASNRLTAQRIADNEQANINKGIAAIYGESAVVSSENDVENEDYKYVNHAYTVTANNDLVGYAYRTTGSNMYGKISLIVGFNLKEEFVSLYLVTDEQTYASTLEENYIAKVVDGSRNVEDVSCGATYGAKLVRDMVNEASNFNKELLK